jgi:RNA polymerase sigma factor (sigma-70 family)
MVSNQIERLYREEKAKMLAYVRSHSVERTRDAEDLVQDVMLKMFRVLNMNTKIENLAAYAWQSLKNLIVDNRRKKEILIEEIDDQHKDFEVDEHGPEELMLREHFSEYMNIALKELKPSELAIWRATEIDGLNYRELAAVWNEPIGTLLSRKYRAEKKILDVLNKIYKGDK